MEGSITRVQINTDTYTVTVTYFCDGLQVSKGASYTEYRWGARAKSMGERIAYATAEATRLCVEEMAAELG